MSCYPLFNHYPSPTPACVNCINHLKSCPIYVSKISVEITFLINSSGHKPSLVIEFQVFVLTKSTPAFNGSCARSCVTRY